MAHSKPQETIVVKDGDGRERVLPVNSDKGLPKKIVKTPKKITTHVSKKAGHKGKAMPSETKKYSQMTIS